MESIKNAASSVTESVSGKGAEASKETHKSVAQDSNASMGTRAGAAKDAVGDKMNEQKHETKSTVDKEAAKH